MNSVLILSLLFFSSLLALFVSSYENFSAISLRKFLKHNPLKTDARFSFVSNFDLNLHILQTFNFFLQITLFILFDIYFHKLIENHLLRLTVLLLSWIIYYNFLLYFLGYRWRDFFFKTLSSLFWLVWYLFLPLNLIFVFFTRALPKKETENDEVTDEEVEVFFQEGAKEGVIQEEDQSLLENVIEFRDTLVKEVMTPRVDMVFLEINQDLTAVVEKIAKFKKTRYPVISGSVDNIIGLLLAKDIFPYLNHPEEFSLPKIMREPLFVPETMRISELLKQMQLKKQIFAIVVDEFGGVSGLVTIEDIIEEIVGEIRDELDEEQVSIVKNGNVYHVRGDTTIYELEEQLGINIEEDENYQTVAGLIAYLLGKIPEAGDYVILKNIHFKVLEVDRNRIKKVAVEKNEAKEAEN